MEETDVKEHNFDYQSIIQRSLLLLKNVEENDDKKQNYIKDYMKEYSKYMELRKQLQVKLNKRLEVTLALKKNLNQISSMVEMVQDVNQNIQQNLTKNDELQAEKIRYSMNLKSKKDEMDKELEDLILRFEGETLQNVIDDEKKELERFLQSHIQMEQTLKELSEQPRFPSMLALTRFANEMGLKPRENFNDLEEKIASTENEIQKIIKEHDEKVEVLQDFQ